MKKKGCEFTDRYCMPLQERFLRGRTERAAAYEPLGRRAFDLERHTLWQRRGVSALVVFASKRTPREHIASVRLQSAARAAADALGQNVSFSQVDCDHYGDVCTAFDAKHRPYVGWFRGGALRSHFDGDRSSRRRLPSHHQFWRHTSRNRSRPSPV